MGPGSHGAFRAPHARRVGGAFSSAAPRAPPKWLAGPDAGAGVQPRSRTTANYVCNGIGRRGFWTAVGARVKTCLFARRPMRSRAAHRSTFKNEGNTVQMLDCVSAEKKATRGVN